MTNRKLTVAAVVAASTVAVLWMRATKNRAAPDARWRVVTVALPESEVAPGGEIPEPLRKLGESAEVRLSPAPGGRGTELAARANLAGGASDHKLAPRIRVALRQSKQLLEAGEVATNEPQPHGRRPATPAGVLVDALSRRSPREGVL
jgi:hypothetical protein